MIRLIFRTEFDPDCTSSGSAANKEATLADNLNSEVETSSGDQTEKEMTLGDALPMNQVKDTALASIEELKNLAGDADIKGLDAVLDKAVHPKHGKRVKDRCIREGCYWFQRVFVGRFWFGVDLLSCAILTAIDAVLLHFLPSSWKMAKG